MQCLLTIDGIMLSILPDYHVKSDRFPPEVFLRYNNRIDSYEEI